FVGSHATSADGRASDRQTHSVPSPTRAAAPPDPRKKSGTLVSSSLARWYAPRSTASSEARAITSSASWASGRSSAARERAAMSRGGIVPSWATPIDGMIGSYHDATTHARPVRGVRRIARSTSRRGSGGLLRRPAHHAAAPRLGLRLRPRRRPHGAPGPPKHPDLHRPG